jgi:hypothetical protein
VGSGNPRVGIKSIWALFVDSKADGDLTLSGA